MYSAEQNIRNYLKTLTVEDIANSSYLFGADFDNDSIESIMQRLNALYREVATLKEMVDGNFKSQNDEHVLLPKDRVSQEAVIQNYYRKESALLKMLSNKDIYDMFINYKIEEEKKTTGPTK